MDTSHQKANLQSLNISEGWTVRQHEFYDIDPEGNVENDDTFWMFSEDLLQIEMDGYVLDLGWYGEQDGNYCLYLIRGNFLTGDLLEKFQSRDRRTIQARIKTLADAVTSGRFDNLSGYSVTEDSDKTMDDFENYSCFKN